MKINDALQAVKDLSGEKIFFHFKTHEGGLNHIGNGNLWVTPDGKISLKNIKMCGKNCTKPVLLEDISFSKRTVITCTDCMINYEDLVIDLLEKNQKFAQIIPFIGQKLNE